MIIPIIIGVFLLYTIYKYYIGPQIFLKEFDKKHKGLFNYYSYYYPVLGHVKEIINSLKIYNDPFGSNKMKVKQDPTVQFRVSMGEVGKTVITLTDANLIKSFVEQQDSYTKELKFFMNKYHGYNDIGLGIFNADGQKWKKLRAILAESFHFNALKKRIPLVDYITEKAINTTLSEDESVDVTGFGEQIASQVIIQSFFGLDFDKKWNKKNRIEQELKDLIYYLSSHPRFSMTCKLKELIFGQGFYQYDFLLDKEEKEYKYRLLDFNKYCHDFIDSKIESSSLEELQKSEEKNFLQILIQKYLEKQIEKEDIFNNFIGFFFAGMDTTGNFAGVAFYALSKNQACQDRLLAEVDYFWQKNSEIGPDTDLNLPYLGRFLKEALRLYTPAPGLLPRKAIKDNMLGSLEIKKGWTVITNYFRNNLDSNKFQNPEDFQPDRWNDNELKRQNPFEFTPFSAGKRNCIGQHLAMIESKIILLKTLRKYRAYCTSEKKQLSYQLTFIYTPIIKDIVKFQKR